MGIFNTLMGTLWEFFIFNLENSTITIINDN